MFFPRYTIKRVKAKSGLAQGIGGLLYLVAGCAILVAVFAR
jgi:hypothetical protein